MHYVPLQISLSAQTSYFFWHYFRGQEGVWRILWGADKQRGHGVDYAAIGLQNFRDDKPDRRRGRSQRLVPHDPLLQRRDPRADLRFFSHFRRGGPAT